nr:3-oxoacyl-[acyl-carrier-protein] reductase FabG-like [Danaus plexippus plexippus]
MTIKNKVVLITGAGSGIGLGIAIRFAKSCAKLSLIDINSDKLDNVALKCEYESKERVLKIVTDISVRDNIKNVVNTTLREYGRIDVVVNCAGTSGNGFITSEELLNDLDIVLNINLTSVIALTHYAANALIESKGCVINIASMLAYFVGKGAIPYIVAKAGVLHFTKCAALELAEKGVRVNSISPGPVKTNILLNIIQNQEKSDEFWDNLGKQTPLGRLVKAEEIAELAVYLASNKAMSITGSDFLIDAGSTLSKL